MPKINLVTTPLRPWLWRSFGSALGGCLVLMAVPSGSLAAGEPIGAAAVADPQVRQGPVPQEQALDWLQFDRSTPPLTLESVGALPIGATPVLLAQGPDVNALLDDAREQIEQGQYGQALSLYQQAAQVETDNAQIYSAIAYAQLRLGSFPAAANSFRQAITLDPRNADFAYGLGRTLGEMGDFQGAVTALRQSLSLNPRHQDALLALGKMLERQGDLNGSLQIYEQLLTLDRRNWQSYTAKADLLMRQDRFGEAIDILEQAQTIAPYETEIYIKLGTAEFGLGNPRAGFAAFEEAAKLDPRNPDLQLKRGAIFQTLGSPELALVAYQQAVKLNPNLSSAREAVVKVYLELENYLLAAVNSELWSERDPQNPLPYQYMGIALRGRGRPVEAMEAFQQARMLYRQAQNAQGVSQVEQLMRATAADQGR